MGYTNKTSHYDLPQWIAGDKPSWLGDVNTAMLNIDTAIAGADASATAAESSAAAANAQVQAQEAKITKNTTDIQALTEQLADVSGVANAALPKNGGTMTGALTLAGAPTQDLQAATKKYVDDNSGKGALMLSGGTMTGPLTLSGEPTADLMAATKKYVDDKTLSVRATYSCNDAVAGSLTNNVTTASLFGFNYNKYVFCASVISGAFAASVTAIYTGPNTADAAYVEMFKAPGNPFNLAVKANPSTANDFTDLGIGANPVSLSATYDGTHTHFYSQTVRGSVTSLANKTFSGSGVTSI